MLDQYNWWQKILAVVIILVIIMIIIVIADDMTNTNLYVKAFEYTKKKDGSILYYLAKAYYNFASYVLMLGFIAETEMGY